MNEHILQSYIDNITMHFGVNQEFIFSEGQKLEKTEPRQLFFYLCHKRGIPIVAVQKFMSKAGFDMHHATIYQDSHGTFNKGKCYTITRIVQSWRNE